MINNKPVDLNNINKFKIFNDAYLINMDIRQDRLLHTNNELNKAGIKYTRFSGLSFNEKGKYKSIGKRGCTESHLSILIKNINNKYPVLIIEDDIVIKHQKLIHEFIQIVPDKWDLLFFYNLNKDLKEMKWINKPTNCTHFYIVNNSSIEKIIELSNNNSDVIDDFYAKNHGKLNIYTTSINVVAQSLKFIPNIEYNWKKELRIRSRQDKFI